MRYLLLIANDEHRTVEAPSEEAWGRFMSDLQTAGKMLGAERLRPSTSATTVRQPNGRTLLSDGPFTESKEQLGGCFSRPRSSGGRTGSCSPSASRFAVRDRTGIAGAGDSLRADRSRPDDPRQ